ncbi:MAG: HTH domain-containing protein [Reyranellaceae bacterium]
MDAYLEIAASILRLEKRPLSPRAILAAAYRNSLVPHHLHGRTQHKTLQARLSEDIVAHRDHSLFFRTAPGVFFLREYLTDTRVPEEFRNPIPTRRRVRELTRSPVLCVSAVEIANFIEPNTIVEPKAILESLENSFEYAPIKEKSSNQILVRSFVCVRRENKILSFRLGRYRDDRDSFLARRTIGFTTLIEVGDHTLFNLRDWGIVDAGVRAIKIDLDLPTNMVLETSACLTAFVWACDDGASNDLLSIVDFDCPDWFEPTKRRLALNDLEWLDTTMFINNIDDFDPWSRIVLLKLFSGEGSPNEKFTYTKPLHRRYLR